MASMEQRNHLQQLLDCIRTTPVIDHHAHNVLRPSEQERHPLLSITTEATGKALQHTRSTLAHMRAVQQLADILGCDPIWTTVQSHLQKRRKEDSESWSRFCFRGIETVLIDDGLDAKTVHPYNWHDRFTRSPCKRIVRIENIAEAILVRCVEDKDKRGKSDGDLISMAQSIKSQFDSEIAQAINDPEVVGFKSVICYRTGLAIKPYRFQDFQVGIETLFRRFNPLQSVRRLQDDLLSPAFVHLTARMLVQTESKKPFQFHTGLGDNDMRLLYSSPSHLQTFIEEYPPVNIVLLHASYPFTKEAGYLASVYPNAYLDIGEVFPMVSGEGQEAVIREALELCPSEKLTWSTDGHWFPETYLLAMLQIRQALEKVMPAYVASKSLTIPAAIKIVEDLLFNTSNKLYDLNLEMKPLNLSEITSDTQYGNSLPSSAIEGKDALERFTKEHPTIKYLRLQWVDYTAMVRVRIIPIGRALQSFSSGESVSVTKAVLGLIQTDSMAAGFTSVGQYQIYPVLSSLRLGARSGHASVQCEFRNDDRHQVPTCPRNYLRTTLDRAKDHGVKFLIGFEIEVVFLDDGYKGEAFDRGTPRVTRGQAWSSARALHDNQMMTILEDIMEQLERSGIGIQQFHPESAMGQYEFVMDPMEPLTAVDSLICARDIIATIASKYGMRATLIPKVDANGAATGSHVHVSLTPVEKHKHFLAGLLRHLPAIMAITLPNVASYERVSDGTWSGGTWVAWGTQNRETPIRYISGSRYEIKCLDGLANPYLAVGAILRAGTQGILGTKALEHKDCLNDPAKLSQDERRALGICRQMPRSIEEALDCFRRSHLREVLGNAVYENYLAVKEAEVEMLQKMESEERRKWLIERY